MSHVIQIRTQVRDPAALKAACRRLGLDEPVHGSTRLFNDAASGLLVKLPGWQYPAVIDTSAGTIKYDNFAGQWKVQT